MQNKNPLSIFGVDLNEYRDKVDFKIIAKKVDFIYLRSSGSGTGKFRVDKKFIEYAKGCRNYKIPVGAYHFGVPTASLTAADSQCDDFINILQQGFGQNDFGDIFPVIDVEVPTNKTITTIQLVAWVDRFRKRFENKTRRKLMIYTGLFFIKLYDDFKVNNKYPISDMPLWIARYSDSKYPADAGGWKKWDIWKFSDKGEIQGINPPVDVNWGPNHIDYLKVPSDVKGVFATMDKRNIYVSWKRNGDKDLAGYNVFVNSNYAGTVGKNISYISIPLYKFKLTPKNPIEIAVEAFDQVGDFSQNRGKFKISTFRNEEYLKENSMYLMGDIIMKT